MWITYRTVLKWSLRLTWWSYINCIKYWHNIDRLYTDRYIKHSVPIDIQVYTKVRVNNIIYTLHNCACIYLFWVYLCLCAYLCLILWKSLLIRHTKLNTYTNVIINANKLAIHEIIKPLFKQLNLTNIYMLHINM